MKVIVDQRLWRTGLKSPVKDSQGRYSIFGWCFKALGVEPEGNLFDKIKDIDNPLAKTLCTDEMFLKQISALNNNENITMAHRKDSLYRVFIQAGHELQFKETMP